MPWGRSGRARVDAAPPPGAAVILCVGGTPAVQRTLVLDSFKVGGVNRARELHVTASGKVTNVARVAATVGGHALLATFLGGDPGRFIAADLDAGGVAYEPVWVDPPTRTCTTLVPDDAPVTELVEEAPGVSEEAVAELEEAVVRRLDEANVLCLSGSFPPGVPEDFYGRLVRRAHVAEVPVIADAQKALLRGALAEGPFLVKPNLEETAAALDLSLAEDESGAGAAVDALTEAGAEWALVTTGATGAMLGDASGARWGLRPPRVEALNPIGSGDSLAAGLAVALSRGEPVPEAAAFGTACAAANVLTPTSGVVRPDDVEKLRPGVRLTRLA